MLFINDYHEIAQLLAARTLLEQKIALGLSDEFNQGQLRNKINFAVYESFKLVCQLKSTYMGLELAINKIEKDNGFLFPAHAKTSEAVCQEYASGKDFSAEQCGCFIRFYGEVIDNCKGEGVWFRKERAKQIAARYGGGGEAFKAFTNSNYIAKADTGTVWQKVAIANGVRSKFGTGGRIRIKAKDDNEGRDFFKGKVNPYYDIIPGSTFETTPMKNANVGKRFGGVMVWKIEDTSTIGKIDKTFGLPFGADISGTTTDNIYFLNGWSDICKGGDPIVMMLPLAAIVGEYHHSLLEVAGAMSLKKVISYSIGFYSTLLPALGGATPMSQRSAIQAMLDQFELDQSNQHFLLYYNSQNKPAGCFIALGDELEAFKRLATIDMRLWPKFNSMGPYPTEDDCMRLFDEVGLRDAALRSRRGALKKMSTALHGWERYF
jgi:hypothetical protein